MDLRELHPVTIIFLVDFTAAARKYETAYKVDKSLEGFSQSISGLSAPLAQRIANDLEAWLSGFLKWWASKGVRAFRADVASGADPDCATSWQVTATLRRRDSQGRTLTQVRMD